LCGKGVVDGAFDLAGGVIIAAGDGEQAGAVQRDLNVVQRDLVEGPGEHPAAAMALFATELEAN
jgi:hypothetical protein